MRITQATLPWLPLLQGFGLNRHVRGWNRILTWLFPLDGQDTRYLETTRWSLPYLANPANYVDWDILCHGSYEDDDLELFRRFGKPSGTVCLDIGANVGHHSIFFGSLGWTVHAFEPNPQLWPEFEAKVRASGLKSITLHRVGIGAEDNSLEFELENTTNSGTGRFIDGSFHSPAGAEKVGRLPVRSGDSYLREAQIDHVGIVKMDIQGFEPEALTGLQETLLRDRPVISLEITPDNAAKFGSFERLKKHFPEGYFFVRTQSINIGPFRRTVIKRYEGDEFQYMDGNLFCVPESEDDIIKFL